MNDREPLPWDDPETMITDLRHAVREAWRGDDSMIRPVLPVDGRLNRDVPRGEYLTSSDFDPPLQGICCIADEDLRRGDMVVLNSRGNAVAGGES